MNKSTQQTKIITLKELSKLPVSLPKSWTKAAGLLRSKHKVLETHLKKLRQEWNY